MKIILILIALFFTQVQTPDFESDCDNISSWVGEIQGVEQAKGKSPYLMAECHTNLNYDLIWVVGKKTDITALRLNNHLKKESDSEIENLKCFAFVIPKTLPSKPENEFDVYDYVFPSAVKVYSKKAGNWELIETKKVDSFSQFGELKLRTVTQK